MQIRLRYFIAAIAAATLTGGAVTGAMLYRPGWPAVSAQPASSAQAVGKATVTKLDRISAILQDGYYTPVEQKKLSEGAITGLVQSLGDPYTVYMPPMDTQAFQQSVSSSFEGIGSEIREEEGHIIVVTPIHGSPSERAGLKPNDILLEVNGKSLEGLKADEAVTFLRGPKGSEARLRIQRAGYDKPFDVQLIRDRIPLETVSSELLPDQMGLIRISRISEPTGHELETALTQLKAQGAKGLILDFRQNPGGLLDVAVKIAQEFVPQGKLLLQVKYRDGQVDQYRSQGPGSKLPVVVVIDKGSASAAEIIAGALKESAGVPLVGETSFGKGLVQSTADLGDGSSLKFTVAQWLTPAGHQINKQGITPDVQVKLPAYAELPYPVVDREYKAGEQGTPIQIVQQMLQVLGYDPGRVDGVLEEGTARALRAFQGKNGLTQTGTLTPATTGKAVALMQQLITENDTQLAKAKEVLRGLMDKQ